MPTFIASRPVCAVAHRDPHACSYRVAWSINPHMRVGAADPHSAHAQHRGFIAALRRAGARVLQLPFLHGAYDSVFMKDSAILAATGGRIRVLPTTPATAERRAEPQARAAQLHRAGVHVAAPLPTPLEGGDVVVVPHRRLALFGHGVRSSRASAAGLARFLGCDVVPLALRDPAFFHLDTALAVLSDDTAVVCERAFTPDALRTLRSLRFGSWIAVAPDEAMRLSLNIVELGGALVTGTDSPMLATWRALGRSPILAPLDQFHLAGGSAACLVAPVHELDVRCRRAVAKPHGLAARHEAM